MIAITLAVELLLMNCIGIFIRRSGVTSKEFSARLTDLLLKFCIPCLIFNSIRGAAEFSPDTLTNCAIVLLLSVGVNLVSFGVGQLFFLLKGKGGTGRLYRYGLIFCHFSFMGIPVIDALFGAMGTFYYSFFLIPVRIAYYTFSQPLMTPGELRGEKVPLGRTLREILLNPCLLAVLLGLIFWVGGWELPTAIGYCVRSLSSVTSPMALLLCGMVIAEYDFRQLLRLKYLALPLLRVAAMPALFFGLSRLLLLLGVEALLCKIMVIYAAFPVASLLPVFSLKYDPDPNNQLSAAAASMLSVLLSAITIPIWYLLL